MPAYLTDSTPTALSAWSARVDAAYPDQVYGEPEQRPDGASFWRLDVTARLPDGAMALDVVAAPIGPTLVWITPDDAAWARVPVGP